MSNLAEKAYPGEVTFLLALHFTDLDRDLIEVVIDFSDRQWRAHFLLLWFSLWIDKCCEIWYCAEVKCANVEGMWANDLALQGGNCLVFLVPVLYCFILSSFGKVFNLSGSINKIRTIFTWHMIHDLGVMGHFWWEEAVPFVKWYPWLLEKLIKFPLST